MHASPAVTTHSDSYDMINILVLKFFLTYINLNTIIDVFHRKASSSSSQEYKKLTLSLLMTETINGPQPEVTI